MLRKINALLIGLTLVLNQSGFCQTAAGPDISGVISAVSSRQSPFRPLHFRSLSFDASTGSFDVYADKGSARNLTPEKIKEDSEKLFSYFLTGLVLPNSAFWVNLRPDRPDMIVDPMLDKTDVGRILLEADLQLKKDLAKLTSPDNPLGKEYWNKLYAKAETVLGISNANIPTVARPWIVPGDIILGESANGAYIYKATLKVMLEQDRLQKSAVFNFDDARLKELNDYSSRLIRTIILPKLTRDVNSAPRYSALRQVYYSLILAQWFKKNFDAASSGGYARRIDSQNISGLASANPWEKESYFREYKNSFEHGEYDKQETVQRASGNVVRRYFSGGMELGAAINTANTLAVRGGIDEKMMGPHLTHARITADAVSVVGDVRGPGNLNDGGARFPITAWDMLKLVSRQGFRQATKIYLSVFDKGQKAAFGEYFKIYKMPKNAVFDEETITTDLKGTGSVKVIGNGLGVLSVCRDYAARLAKELHLANGTYNLRDLLTKNPDHVTIITAGGKAQRNPKYSQIGKCLARVPMVNGSGKEASYIIDPLLDIAITIENNYENEFMFSVIYGDALISFDPGELSKILSSHPEIKKGLSCLLLKMDWKEALNYGFAKVSMVNGVPRVDKFQEKYSFGGKDTGLQAKVEKENNHPAFRDAKTDLELMYVWLKENGYLVDGKYILMNPAFSVAGLDAFLGYALLSGVIDSDGNMHVANGKAVIQDSSYLSRALAGQITGKNMINIDNFGEIVPSFAAEGRDAPIGYTLAGFKGKLYGITVDGDWYDIGGFRQEQDIILQKKGYAGLLTTFGIVPSANSVTRLRGNAVPSYSYNSAITGASGGISPLSIQIDSFVDADVLVLEDGSQLYNVDYKGRLLHMAGNYILIEGAVKRDGNDFVCFPTWHVEKDDVKKSNYGGRSLEVWAGDNRLSSFTPGPDLFTTRLFPMVSLQHMQGGDPIDELDAMILKELPAIIEFLQGTRNTAPAAYREAVQQGRLASFDDTYSSPAPQAFVSRRSETARKVALALEQAEAQKQDGGKKEPGVTAPAGAVGGVDFASLPATTMAMDRLSVSGRTLVDLPALRSQLVEMRKEMRLGHTPFAQLREFVRTVKDGKNTDALLNVCAYSIAEVLRKEEENAIPTAEEMRNLLSSLFN